MGKGDASVLLLLWIVLVPLAYLPLSAIFAMTKRYP